MTTQTTDPDVSTMLHTITTATHPEDVFGPRTTDKAAHRAAKRLYRRSAALLHPDKATEHNLTPEQATAAFAALSTFYTAWTHEPTTTTPDPTQVTITGRTNTYTLGNLIARGTITNVYTATTGTGQTVAVKIPRDPTSNPNMDAERTALTTLKKLTTNPDWAWARPYFPDLLDTATHRDGHGNARHVNILNNLTPANGYHTLTDVLNAYPHGLDGRDWAWMHRRLLRAIATAHHTGLIHGAILPSNVLIHPDHHGVVLTGWTLTATPDKPLPGRDKHHLDSYPPEATTAATTKTDVYMAHALMTRMLNPTTNQAQLAFATGCMQHNPGARPAAHRLLDEYDNLLDRAYGQRTFRPFTIPSNTNTGSR